VLVQLWEASKNDSKALEGFNRDFRSTDETKFLTFRSFKNDLTIGKLWQASNSSDFQEQLQGFIMASATGIPENVPGVEADENEPLLGRVGDASQQDGKALWHNLVIGKFH